MNPQVPGRWIAAVVVLATLVVGWPLLLPVVYDTHDGHYALYNAAQFDHSLRDGQFPVRWLPDLFGGRGLPHFLYYHPLAFLGASLLHLLGFGFIASLKVLYLLGLGLSGWAAYSWLSGRLPAIHAGVGAVAYLLAPFRAVEIHVKGDPPAALAFVFLPLVLLGIDRAAAGRRGGVLVLGLATAGLVLSHSVTALLALPAFALYAAMEVRPPLFRPAARIAAGVSCGAAASAFFWLPAFVERSLVHIDSPLGILFFDFHDHFVAPWQWLSPLWGYHGSFAGTQDDMAFQVGPLHAVGMVAAVLVIRRIQAGPARRVAIWAVVVCAFYLLGTVDWSLAAWERLPLLRLVQFPWRLLSVIALASSACLAVASSAVPERVLLVTCAVAPALVTAIFALVLQNPWYVVVALAYAAAGLTAWLLFRARQPGIAVAQPVVALLLCAVAVPWSAVPLHSAWRGEPSVIEVGEADLRPGRVRLGIRRTTARDDYLPRTVREIPPRDPDQEYLPPPGAVLPDDVEVDPDICRVLWVRRHSTSLVLEYEAASATRATLNLHEFPGWRTRIVGGGLREIGRAVDDQGRIVLDLPPGNHLVEVRFGKTAPRRIGDGLALLGWLALGVAGLVALPEGRRRRG